MAESTNTIKITGVAIMMSDNIFFCLPKPKRHHHILHMLARAGITLRHNRKDQGFVTNEGKFVTREEALIIAREAGQLLPCHEHETQLFSESVW